MLRGKGHDIFVRQRLGFTDLAAFLFDTRQGLNPRFEHLPTGFRQFDGLAGPIDQLRPDPGFERLDPATERWLAQVRESGRL